ncbi:MAG: peroxiredoxin [Candidatus Marinimicrobia bacterium]|nr:peroxiredoxin [Candidatus Neomarinimicrobiota bacterium]MCF7840145.1 peroxiredoxin [Candidatus Neomarinimicrobiota bacterium]
MSVKVGRKVDNFKTTAVIGQEFKEISLDDYKGKYVVLFFYPMDFTFVCPTEILKFNELYPEFQKRNVEVIAVSTDSKFSHLAWKNTPVVEGGIGDIKYPMIADFTKDIGRQFDVLVEDSGVALRGTFLIDKEQVLQHATINNLDLGRNIHETLRMVDALQYTEEHGEVCPAEWESGQKALDPSKDGLKVYFTSLVN